MQYPKWDSSIICTIPCPGMLWTLVFPHVLLVSSIRSECCRLEQCEKTPRSPSEMVIALLGACYWLCVVRLVPSLVKGISLLLSANLSQGMW